MTEPTLLQQARKRQDAASGCIADQDVWAAICCLRDSVDRILHHLEQQYAAASGPARDPDAGRLCNVCGDPASYVQHVPADSGYKHDFVPSGPAKTPEQLRAPRCKVCGSPMGIGPHAEGMYSHPFEPDIALCDHLAEQLPTVAERLEALEAMSEVHAHNTATLFADLEALRKSASGTAGVMKCRECGWHRQHWVHDSTRRDYKDHEHPELESHAFDPETLAERVAGLEAMSETHSHNIATLFRDFEALPRPMSVPAQVSAEPGAGQVRCKRCGQGAEARHPCNGGIAHEFEPGAPTIRVSTQDAPLLWFDSQEESDAAARERVTELERARLRGMQAAIDEHTAAALSAQNISLCPNTLDLDAQARPPTVTMHELSVAPGETVRLPGGQLSNHGDGVVFVNVAAGTLRMEPLTGSLHVERAPADIDLDELQRLCDAATSGPWRANSAGEVLDEDGDCVLDAITRGREDAEFAAAARDALPILIAEVRRLQAQVERLHGDACEAEALEHERQEHDNAR